MLLEVEADQGMASDPSSLMDRVMVGIITACRMFYKCFHDVVIVIYLIHPPQVTIPPQMLRYLIISTLYYATPPLHTSSRPS